MDKPMFSAQINNFAKLGYDCQSENKCDSAVKLLAKLKRLGAINYTSIKGKGIIVESVKDNADKTVAANAVKKVQQSGIYKALKNQDIILQQIFDVLIGVSKLLNTIASSQILAIDKTQEEAADEQQLGET
jgi:hypothetical protein